MTESSASRHSEAMAQAMPTLADEEPATRTSGEQRSGFFATGAGWESVYEEHFDFVWRSLRRLGVPVSALDDAAQEVFIVAFRRAGEFEGRSTLKTWLFGIAWNVARRASRGEARREGELPEQLADSRRNQEDAVSRAEAVRTVYEILDGLDEDKRAVFVMAELEEMSAPEIAEVTGAPLNTVYSRLRAARSEFEAALRRHRARDEWRRP